MKKILLFAAAAALAGFAAPAMAQSTGTVTIDGSVADRCLFTTDAQTINLGELAQSGTGTSAGKLDSSTVDGKNATLVGWCNGTAATMAVEAQPLLNTGTAPTGFDNRVNYTATATANSVDATDDSFAAGAGTPQTVGIFTGDVKVALSGSSTPTTGLLVAGDYAGQVLVTLSPGV